MNKCEYIKNKIDLNIYYKLLLYYILLTYNIMDKFKAFEKLSFIITEEIIEPSIFDLDVDFYEYEEYDSDSTESIDIDYMNHIVTKEDIKKSPIKINKRAQTIYEIKLKEVIDEKKKINRSQSLIIIKSKLKSFFNRIF